MSTVGVSSVCHNSNVTEHDICVQENVPRVAPDGGDETKVNRLHVQYL